MYSRIRDLREDNDLSQSQIAKILGIDRPKSTILIGMGNLGRAVTMHMNFEANGFTLIGLFDEKESLIGQVVKNLPIRSTAYLDEFCKESFYIPVRPSYNISRWTKTVSFGR